MTRQGGGSGRILLWVVLGIVGIIVVGKMLSWLIGALWSLLLATLLIGAIVGVALLTIRAVKGSLSDRS